jgi:hypothetical protein
MTSNEFKPSKFKVEGIEGNSMQHTMTTSMG